MSTGTEDAVSENPVSENADLPHLKVTINQLVGYNMTRYRKAAGLTQEELGERLGGWTKVAVSAAERSWDGKRVRKFDADEILAIAAALGVPVVALLLPPSDAGRVAEYTFTADSDAMSPMGVVALLGRVLPSYGALDSPTMETFRERLMALGISRFVFPSAEEADATLQRAADESAKILAKARDAAVGLTGDARARAESLERDAIARHRQAMGSLVQQRDELERRVDDLRAFEREYRSRLGAYLEGQLRDLRAGAADSGTFPAVHRPGPAESAGPGPR